MIFSMTKLDAMIETMNEQHEHFVSEMREFGLLHETDPSPVSYTHLTLPTKRIV